MLAAKSRSGLVESIHDGTVAVVSADGGVVASSGDIHRPFYLRSAAKPFQALISQREGAALAPVELALGCASHDGQPAHIAIVASILASAGLDSSALQCPPDWPLSTQAARRMASRGFSQPRPIWHNCSGKHAAWLKACSARDWPIESYLEPGHPLQKRVVALVSELGEFPAGPVGVDGCGAPVLRGTARSMGLLYARLATLPELQETFGVMHRYPALVSGNGNGDATIATSTNAVAKRGAAGCLAVAVRGRFGVAVKAWDGSSAVADVAAISALDQLGELTSQASAELEELRRPLVRGGGESVGSLESRLELTWG